MTCTLRQDFLRWRDESWQILQADELANRATEAPKGIQHTFDTNEEFRWLCEQMLGAHGLKLGSLDIFQVIELLFLSEDEEGQTTDGILVRLQFPPIPPGSGRQLEPDEDPYFSLMASLAYASGNWMQAKQVLGEMTYQEVVELSRHLEMINKKDKPPKPSQTPQSEGDATLLNAKKEAIAQQAKTARMQGAVQGIKNQQIEAIKKAIEEKKNGTGS